MIDDIPKFPYLSGRCRRFSNIGTHGAAARISGRIQFGLGIRSVLKRLLPTADRPAEKPVKRVGGPSQFAEGDWVRVLDASRLREVLDTGSKTRGLEFCAQQWFSCGRVYRVSKVVRRIIDDAGALRPVSRTVLVDGVDCGGENGSVGCGRFCPMMFRDEWLEPVVGAQAPFPMRLLLGLRCALCQRLRERSMYLVVAKACSLCRKWQHSAVCA